MLIPAFICIVSESDCFFFRAHDNTFLMNQSGCAKLESVMGALARYFAIGNFTSSYRRIRPTKQSTCLKGVATTFMWGGEEGRIQVSKPIPTAKFYNFRVRPLFENFMRK